MESGQGLFNGCSHTHFFDAVFLARAGNGCVLHALPAVVLARAVRLVCLPGKAADVGRIRRHQPPVVRADVRLRSGLELVVSARAGPHLVSR